MRRRFYWLFLLFLGLPSPAVANREVCGVPPPEQFREENNESIKGDLAGKANFLSSFVGKAELGGKIESTRKEIFAKYSDANAAYMDRYLAYMFCFVLFDPKNPQNPNDKIKAIQEFKQQQQKPRSSIDDAKNNLALSIKEPADDLANRAEAARIPGSIEAKNYITEYNRLLNEAKDRLPNEPSIQVLRELEYTRHHAETGKMVATAARKLARVADGLMAGGMEAVQKAEDKKPKIPPATPPQLRSEGRNHQKTAQATPSKPTEVLDKTLHSEQMDIPQSGSLVADAKKIVDALRKEQYSDVVQHFTEEMRQAVPVGRLQMVWRDMIARNGSYKTIASVRQQKREYKQELLDVVIMTVEFERARFDTEASYNSNRQIVGLWFEPTTGKGYMCSVLSKATTMWGLAQGIDACPQAIKACSAYGATDCAEAFKGTYSADQANTVTVHCLQNSRDFTGKGRQVIQEAYDFAVQSKWYGCVFRVKHF